MKKDSECVLMNVNELDSAIGISNDDDIVMGCEMDEVSNAPMYAFSTSQVSETKNLKLKLAPVMCRSLLFSCSKGCSSLYSMDLPFVDNSKEFSQYVSKLFEIYKSLGQNRQFNIPTIGLIKHSSTMEHNLTVNLAFEMMVSELELFIESVKDTNRYQRLVDLEECLIVLNCLKTIHFTLDSKEPDSRLKFIRSLINWVNRSDGQPSEEVIATILEGDTSTQVQENPYFWKLLFQLILRGLFSQAISAVKKIRLLEYMKSRCSTTHTMLEDLINLLNSYPYESEDLFREWKNLVMRLYANWIQTDLNISSTLSASLEDILLLISGNKSKILFYAKTWYESYCGLMLFYIPSIQLSEEYLQLSLKEHPFDVTNTWEQSCVDIINAKIYFILPVLDSHDSCTAAFTAAICEAKGLLENALINDEDLSSVNDWDIVLGPKSSMSSYLLNQFALAIISNEDKNMWHVAIGIISLIPNFNNTTKRMIIAEILCHYPFQTNDDIEWMLTICAKWKLPHISRTVFKILGQDALYSNNIIEAMSNFSKAEEFGWVRHYSWMIFEASVLQGFPLDDEVVNAIILKDQYAGIPRELVDTMVTPAMMQSLSPYAVLFEFYQAIDEEKWNKALEFLLSLIEFPYLPQQYFILLLARFLYPLFLQDKDKSICEHDILRIIKTLDKLENPPSAVSKAMYTELLRKNDQLPEQLASFIQSVRSKLGLKLCKELM